MYVVNRRLLPRVDDSVAKRTVISNHAAATCDADAAMYSSMESGSLLDASRCNALDAKTNGALIANDIDNSVEK